MSAPRMPRGDRIIKAQVAGAVVRLAKSDMPFDQQVEELDSITRNPKILGMELGDRLSVGIPGLYNDRTIELLRAAGADEAEAARRIEWQRERERHRAEGEPWQ